jgi:hypothetical protein
LKHMYYIIFGTTVSMGFCCFLKMNDTIFAKSITSRPKSCWFAVTTPHPCVAFRFDAVNASCISSNSIIQSPEFFSRYASPSEVVLCFPFK